MFKAEDLLMVAINETNNLDLNEVFCVKDLFKGYVWNRLPVKERHLLGTLFLYHIKTNNIGIEPIEKAVTGQQLYRKIK